jgi:hypothetical protein
MHFVMEQRMLRGIKERAEGAPLVSPVAAAVARTGWVLAGLAILGSYLSRRDWQPWVMLPVFSVFPALELTGDFNAALAGFLAIGVTILGALTLGRRWWAPYVLICAVVLLTLLLTPDAYLAFGLLFLAIIAVALVARLQSPISQRPFAWPPAMPAKTS